jgi:GLPGLI family protein
MKQVLSLFGLIIFGIVLVSSAQGQTVKVKYKKFVVPGQTEYGRWVSSPAMKRQMREREEKMASSVAEYYTLYTDGRASFFEYDTLIQREKIDENDSWWRRMGEVKQTQAKDLRTGDVTHRSPILADSVCSSENFKSEYEWKASDGFKVFAGLPCQKVVHMTEEGDSLIVWYTPEIPMPDGPETFGGAPGLILAVEGKGFNYIADEVEVGDFDIPMRPLPPDQCLEKKEFAKKMRTAAMKKFMQN